MRDDLEPLKGMTIKFFSTLPWEAQPEKGEQKILQKEFFKCGENEYKIMFFDNCNKAPFKKYNLLVISVDGIWVNSTAHVKDKKLDAFRSPCKKKEFLYALNTGNIKIQEAYEIYGEYESPRTYFCISDLVYDFCYEYVPEFFI